MLLTLQQFPEPRLMLHPTIPQPMWGCAPRVFLGQDWWNAARREAYRSRGYCCWCCGVHASLAKFSQTLEAHEAYDIDPQARIMTFVGTVALCHVCHAGIHFGLTSRRYADGKISRLELETVVQNRADRLKEAYAIGGCPYWRPVAETSDSLASGKWRMKIGDRFFSPEDRPSSAVRRRKPAKRPCVLKSLRPKRRNRGLPRKRPGGRGRVRAPKRRGWH